MKKFLRYAFVLSVAFASVSTFAAPAKNSPRINIHQTVFTTSGQMVPVIITLQFSGAQCSRTTPVSAGLKFIANGSSLFFNGDGFAAVATNCGSVTVGYMNLLSGITTQESMQLTWNGTTYTNSNPAVAQVTLQ